MTDGPVPVSVVIAAHNEEQQIGACVGCVWWAAVVLVVENDSTDDTLLRARTAGATVFSHPFTTIGRQRNAAIDRALCDWVLVLDADERASPALGDEVRRRVGEAAAPEAYRIRRRNVFLGRDIRHGGWQNDQPVRLFRRDLRYDDSAVHEHVVTIGRVGVLDAAIRHEPYATLDEYFAKLARYSRDWARQHYARGRRASVWMLLVKPPARFVSMYVFRGGWRDGAHGVLLAVLAAVSVASKYAQLWALVRQQPGDRWAPS